MRKLFGRRWVTIGLLAAGLVGLTVTGASAGVNYNASPPTGSFILGPGCGNQWGYWQTYGDGWQPTSSADYSGADVYQEPWLPVNRCDGTSYNVLTQTTETASSYWDFTIQATHTENCQIYAYIPSNHAGDYDTRYDFWATNGNTLRTTWLGWPGETVNQEPLAGWIQIGIDLPVPAGTQILAVTLSNADPGAPGRWAGAGDMAFTCQ